MECKERSWYNPIRWFVDTHCWHSLGTVFKQATCKNGNPKAGTHEYAREQCCKCMETREFRYDSGW